LPLKAGENTWQKGEMRVEKTDCHSPHAIPPFGVEMSAASGFGRNIKRYRHPHVHLSLGIRETELPEPLRTDAHKARILPCMSPCATCRLPVAANVVFFIPLN
jgi:hypothetical protein